MSAKRSRALYEADFKPHLYHFVAFGSPLPATDGDAHDDGSYVPLHLQEVRDERGRKRLHGAFTGGWSAGYFNTVGSKEGWTPSTFVSSLTNRRKDAAKGNAQKLEDFMDDEDLADAASSQTITTAQEFAGLGGVVGAPPPYHSLEGLFQVRGETMGTRLLKRMGWKDGQGIGPKIRRVARLDLQTHPGTESPKGMHLFAPEDIAMVRLPPKNDTRGIGFLEEDGLNQSQREGSRQKLKSRDYGTNYDSGCPSDSATHSRHNAEDSRDVPRGGIGVGVLNDTSSDDDEYSSGPRISYSRHIGGTKIPKRGGSKSTTANPALKSLPVFVSRRAGRFRDSGHSTDSGQLLPGFASGMTLLGNGIGASPLEMHAAPSIPPGWHPGRRPIMTADLSDHSRSPSGAHPAPRDPGCRAAILGEHPLPGKSVFDYMTSTTRERLLSASTKLDPSSKREGHQLSRGKRLVTPQGVYDQAPKLEKQTAAAALARWKANGGPYTDSVAKQSRYKAYLEHHAGLGIPLPQTPDDMPIGDFVNEFEEFHKCATIFKPMTGFMASRFTTSSTTTQGSDSHIIPVPGAISATTDPAIGAARLGLFGTLTRSDMEFHPTRLLCKRFNVAPPKHVNADDQQTGVPALQEPPWQVNLSEIYHTQVPRYSNEPVGVALPGNKSQSGLQPREPVESEPRHEAVFRSVFGDDTDEDT